MSVVLHFRLVSYKYEHALQNDRARDEPALTSSARLDDLSEPAAPPPPRPRRPRGGPHDLRLQLARPARGDDLDAPAHDEHGCGGGRTDIAAQHRREAGGAAQHDDKVE